MNYKDYEQKGKELKRAHPGRFDQFDDLELGYKAVKEGLVPSPVPTPDDPNAISEKRIGVLKSWVSRWKDEPTAKLAESHADLQRRLHDAKLVLTRAEEARMAETLAGTTSTLQAENTQAILRAASELGLDPSAYSEVKKQALIADKTSEVKLKEAKELKKLDYRYDVRRLKWKVKAAIAFKHLTIHEGNAIQMAMRKALEDRWNLQHSRLDPGLIAEQLKPLNKYITQLEEHLDGLRGRDVSNDNRPELREGNPTADSGGHSSADSGTSQQRLPAPALGDGE